MKETMLPSVKLNEMLKSALFSALIIIGTYIRLPIYVVPFTLQFLFTNLSVLMLGKKWGTISVALYILLGLIGLPVFSGGGGIRYLISPTFGYIIGFMAGTYAAGYLIEKLPIKAFPKYLIAGLLNLLIVYTFGVVYYYLIAKFFLGPIPITKLLWSGAIIFIPVDVASCLLGALIAVRIQKNWR